MCDKPLTYIVSEDKAGLRFDKVLALAFPDYSRVKLKQWIEAGFASLDHVSFWKCSAFVQAGQVISLMPQKEIVTVSKAQEVHFDIAHEDEALLVINKPAGLVVHPGAGNPDKTLVNGLMHYLPSLEQLPRAGIVHRIDKDTTGLLVVAKTLQAHTYLTRLLEKKKIKRQYDAVIYGELIAGGTIDQPIGRDARNRVRMSIHPFGRSAVTHYRIAEKFKHFTHLKVDLETGRTHQIRVHFSALKKPLVGDPVYGGRLCLPKNASETLTKILRKFKRQALHASLLSLTHPVSKETLSITAALPNDMVELLAVIGGHT